MYPSTTLPVFIFHNLGSLQIRHSQEADEGKYECVAYNEAGVAYSYGANLYVRGKTCLLMYFDSSLLIYSPFHLEKFKIFILKIEYLHYFNQP